MTKREIQGTGGKKKKARIGRPSSYSEEIANKIFEGMAEGRSLSAICKKRDMPGFSTVFGWLTADRLDNSYNGFAAKYERAMGERAMSEFEGIVALEDELLDREGGRFKTKEDISAVRVVLDSRRWRLARMAPKTFGDRLAVDARVEHSVAPAPVDKAPSHIKGLLEARARDPKIIDVTPDEVKTQPPGAVPPVDE